LAGRRGGLCAISECRPWSRATLANLAGERLSAGSDIHRGRVEERLQVGVRCGVPVCLCWSRPVRAFVHLKRFDVPSVARRVFLGGAAVIEAEVDLRDAKTGASVLYYSGDSSTKLLFGGLSVPVTAAIAGIRDVRSFTTFCCNTTSGSCAALSPEALLTRSSQTARGRSACA
jgi:hypothetical protein